MSKYNVDLMLAVREQITSHPETHKQEMWATRTECGTTYCIAGWAAALSGKEMFWEPGRDWPLEASYLAKPDGGQGVSVDRYARGVLGLDQDEADFLFSGARPESEALAYLDELIEKGKNQP